MKTLTKAFIFFISLPFIVSCKKDNPAPAYSSDYFPLNVGDKWEYRFYTKEVTKLKTINNKEYYEVLFNQHQYNSDTIIYTSYEYIRKTADGKVYELSQDQKDELLIYDFTVRVNQSWTYNDGAGGWKVTNADDKKVVTINDNVIENCIEYNYDIVEMVDDEHMIVLAPGIGQIVSQSFAWGLGDTLRNAHINGVEYKFK